MNPLHLTLLTAFLTSAALSQVKPSSRNPVPLSKRSSTKTSSARSQNAETGIPATPKQTPERETVTRFSFIGPKTGWGFVKAPSSYYAPDGQNLGKLEGGTLFKYSDVKSTSRNAVLVATIKRGDIWEGPYLLDCTDIAAYDGDPDTISPEIIGNLHTYFTLTGKIMTRRETLAEQHHANNPYFLSAKQAQGTYLNSIEKAAALEKQAAALTGQRKVKVLDELRSLKYEQTRIKAKAEQEAAAYKRWKDAHPLNPSTLSADPQLQALESERRQAKSTVADLIPREE